VVTNSVLVVEDNTDLRESMIDFLIASGFNAVGVGTAAEFYKQLDKEWNVAVIDIGLPDQSGYELVQHLHKNTGLSAIILTARNTADDRIKGYDVGADLYLTKPVDGRELVAAIHNVLKRSQQRAMPEQPLATTEGSCCWFLHKSAWQLIAPDGACIDLTGKEIQFVELLADIAADTSESISRDDLLMKLYNRNDMHSNRAMDALVRRLRSKISMATDEPQPVKTVHAEGYRLSSPLKVLR